MSANNRGIVFLVHGTRNPKAGPQIHAALKDLCARFSETANLPSEAVIYGFIEALDPLLPDALEGLCRQGLTSIRILPLLLFPGSHLYHDVPEMAESVAQRHSGVTIEVGGHIGVDEPEFMGILLKRMGA